MKRAPPESTVMSTSCSSAKHPKLDVSCNTTVNIDDITIAQDSVIIPRSYQTELVEQAKNENLIVCLPTGSGKTYIAVMLIKELAQETRKSIHDGGKRTVFLVKTVVLVQQQSDYIRIHTDLTVGTYYGDLGVDSWSKEKWINEFENHQVLVFTAQVFLNLIEHNYFPLYNVNLLIFDECQHSTGESCYPALMRRYNECHDPPRILGLTASISAKKITPYQLSNAVQQIEQTYKARVASGTNREESNRHGTSVQFEPIRCLTYQDQLENDQESIKIPFETIQSIVDDLKPYLSKQKAERGNIEQDLVEFMLMTDYLDENFLEYNARSVDYTMFLQSEYVNLPRLKHYLENLLHTGYELGIYGLFLAAKALQKTLKSSRARELITDERGKELFDSSVRRIDCLTDDILRNLIHINQNNDEILFSSKVLNLFHRIKQDIDKDSLGQKSSVGSTAMTAKYKRQTIKEFRSGEINVLVATAVVEEGLDIPKCNLVFRFNRPPNFSSYMQSKGRARAKQNASYVILIDGLDGKSVSNDMITYQSYEQIEKMLQEEFSIDNDDDFDTADLNQLEPYRTENGAVISAVRAAQIIYQYCAIIGNGQLCPPRILYHKTSQSTFISVLSMPANCPVSEDVKVKQFERQINTFPRQSNDSSDTWHLYRINIRKEKDKLGFIVPSKLVDIPRFSLYDAGDEILTVDITYVKTIEYQKYKIELESFCKYLFEHVFDGIIKGSQSILKFNTEQSSFKLFPCLLKNCNEINVERMLSICNRLNKPIKHYSQLSDNELYVAWYLSHKPFYIVMPACGLHRKILHNSTDLFGHISSYAGDEDVFPKDQSVDQYLSKDLDQWADSTAPKALADVFEALVGAIFLDSGNSLDVVWRVVEPLLGKYLDQSINHPNLNPIRSFTETGGKIVHESIDKSDDRPIAICIVRTANGVLVKGCGFNAKIAKMNACRQALKK
ncbi:unnamed protein product [Rotaria sordida]|uniref:Uncharacterized protein n=1 Tax=Rotaria sordida TaxID=392033 RepID=A0A815IVL1_9BILA|nr:unnamed protein product [Rotaria sordida]CAF1368613.1 unnamed protein product [Rotaria sordida]